MNVLIGIIAFLIMLNGIVVIHELGHLLMAKKFGVFCREFSIGMGPALYTRQGKETQFSIRALPIGGYVMMAGEEDGSQDEEDEESWLKDVPAERRLNNKPKWQQIIVMGAGVFMNLVLAAVLMIGVTAARGYVTGEALPIADSVTEGSPAAEAGMQPGDKVVKITASDGSVLVPQTQSQMLEFIQFHPGESTYEVDRNGESVELKITPKTNPETKVALIGITSKAQIIPVNFLEAIPAALSELWNSTVSIFRALGMLIQGKGLNALSGPVGIYNVTSTVVSQGMLPYISLVAILSLNIGIFNLLPLPALDGGRILIIMLEGLFRRKIPTKVVETVIIGSFVILFGIMIFATWNDISKLFF
ncbi:MAG: RIP metalloprotease RseP [Erysipelotrichaceae bacterium]|nr:RIP metalloprotease RseP [Erysipelotrichaceae bacterium]